MPKQSSGLSAFSLLDLPPAEQAVLKLLIRQDALTKSALHKGLAEKQLGASEIDNALESLEKQKWLRKTRIGDTTVYSVVLAQRGTSNLAEVNLHRRTSTQSLTSVIHLLESLEGVAKPAAEVKPAGSRSILFVLLVLGIVNSFVLGVLDVVAISGFVTELGTRNLPWLWITEMIVGLLISGSYLRVIDRLPRLFMMKLVLGLLVFIYILLFSLFMLGISTRILYPLVYLVYSQQVIIFPIIFWNLASNFYSMAEARRIFPILASGETIGNLIGYSLFSLPGLVGLRWLELSLAEHPSILIGTGAGFLLASLAVCGFVLRQAPDKTQKAADEKRGVLQDVRDAYGTIRAIPLFRFLFLTMTLVWVVLTILWFQFYTTLDQMSSSPESFSTFYSVFSICLMLVPLVMQWLLIAAMMRRIPPRNVALGIPTALIVSLIAFIVFPLPVIAIGAIFLPIVLDKAWDTPVFQTLQNLIPEDRRGRVSALLNNYTYAFGTIGGGFLITILVFIGNRLAWTASWIREISLVLALIAALGAIAAAWRVRTTYEDSMFSWRLTRRQRTDLLEKIE